MQEIIRVFEKSESELYISVVFTSLTFYNFPLK